MANVLIVAAHPDDETLGAGGTILKHKNNGDNIFWLIVTNISESQGFSSERVGMRQNEIEIVAENYKFNEVIKFDIPTMSLNDSNLNDLIPRISKLFERIKPEVIYIMNRSDAHSDHRVIFRSVMACTKSFRYSYVKKVLMYECISETEFSPILPENVFQPNYYVDISDFFNKKIEIMNVFKSEMGEHPFPRSNKNIEALAIFRGAYAGVQYAEAFQLIKLIEK
jgi:LmbE family N-acetylglucosaminyl deacetylase